MNDPTESQSAMQLVLALAFLSPIMSAAAAWAGVLLGRRRNPPLPEEMYRDFATKRELADLRQEFLKTQGEVFQVLRDINGMVESKLDSVDDKIQALTRAIGNLEGQIKTCPYLCKARSPHETHRPD